MDQAEGLRQMVRNQSPKQVSSARVITITSGKGGVGKSSTAVNLALQFTKLGKKVIILDADFGLANIEVMFGVMPQHNLSDILFKGKELKDIIMEGPGGIGFISGGSGIIKLANMDGEQIKSLVNQLSELEQMADVLIIDTGAGIAPSVLEFVAASEEVILVTTSEPTSITDAYALLKALNMFEGFDKNVTKIKVLCNKVNSINEGKNLFEKLSVVVTKFLDMNISMLGCVPQDYSVTKAIMKQKPVSIMYPGASATKAYEDIIKVLMDEESAARQKQKINVSRFFINVFNRRR